MEDHQSVDSQVVVAAEHAAAGEFTVHNPKSSQDTDNYGTAESGPFVSTNVAYDEMVGSNPDGTKCGQSSTSAPHRVTCGLEHGSNEAPLASVDAGTLDNAATGAGASTYPTEHASLNGNTSEMTNYQSGGATENGGQPNEMAGPVIEQAYDDVIYSAEEDRLWNIVRVNCLDFAAWTALIEETEKVAENNIIKIRKVYDAFVSEFPLCFGYWKKYADHEGRLDSIEKVVEVYERAVLAVTYSVDIWVNYCQLAISTYEDPDIIRRLFERGLAYVGTDYRSDALWDEYIRYEESQQAWSHLAMIYTRILENPIQQLDRYFNCFKELATTRRFSEICTTDEAALLIAGMDTSAQGLEQEVQPDGVDQSSKPVSEGLSEAEELEKYIAIREEMYKKAKEYDSKIVGFETAIRRPYFHVRPLDTPELGNWHRYLDFIEGANDFNKVIKLYERCVIACANYPEFWIRYMSFMEASGSIELANNALARATQVFVKKQPDIHLFAARFKELNGDVTGARQDYHYLYSGLFPGLLEAIVKHANMEYRLGDKESAFSVYEKAIATEKEKSESPILPMLLVQYSRFLYLVAGDLDKAREILVVALEELHLSKPVLEAVIHLESISSSEKHIEFLDSLVDKFITPDPNNPDGVASSSEREELSCIFLEFLDLFGDAQANKKANNRHASLFQRHRSVVLSKKRSADDSLFSEKDKMAKTGDPVQSIMGAYPSVPNIYDQKASVWPMTSQAQGQQWTAAYQPQAGYSAYGGYVNYGHQMPQTAPQATAYGAYAPTYSAQAYPQQNYVQTATAAAPAPAAAPTTFLQQPTTAPQQYYGTYY